MNATVIQTGVSHSGLGEGSGFLGCGVMSLGKCNSSAYTTLIVQAEGTMVFQNTGNHTHDDKSSHTRRCFSHNNFSRD